MYHLQRFRRFMLSGALLSTLVIAGEGINALSPVQAAAGFQTSSSKPSRVTTAGENEQTKQTKQTKGLDSKGKSDSKGKKDNNGKGEKNNAGPKITPEGTKEKVSVGVTGESGAMSAVEKEKMLQTMLMNILGSVSNINTIEYGILAQVEVATLLWDSDRERATNELKTACDRLREFTAEEKDSRDTKSSKSEKRKFKMAILRRIARLNPDLIRDLMETKPGDEKSRFAVVPEWTDEAQALMVTAMEGIEHDPAAAARLAQESLSYGITTTVDFLINLRQRDPKLAEQEAFTYLNKLRDSPVPPMFLLNFRRFIFKEDMPPELQEHFFESLAIRLRRGLKPDLSRGEYEDLVIAAKAAKQLVSNNQQWLNEYGQLVSEYEALMARKSLAAPSSPPARSIRTNNVADGPIDTREISGAAMQAEKFFDAKNRDKEYRKLATEAAFKTDVQLAEKLMSQIKDEDTRRITSVDVYSPLARKALMKKDWLLAKNYVMKITDPLGRSLAIDWVAKDMSSAKQDKQMVKEVYDAGLLTLGQDSPSLNVAKGYMILAKSFLATTPEDGFTTVDSAISILNRSEIASPFSEKSAPAAELGPWVKRKTPMIDVEEALDLTETIGPLFREMSKHDINRARQLAINIMHQGLSSLAELGVARQLLDEIKETKRVIERSKKATPEK